MRCSPGSYGKLSCASIKAKFCSKETATVRSSPWCCHRSGADTQRPQIVSGSDKSTQPPLDETIPNGARHTVLKTAPRPYGVRLMHWTYLFCTTAYTFSAAGR